MAPTIDLTGQRFGRLIVVGFHHSDGGAHWLCRCDCGAETVSYGGTLRRGGAKSCGCLQSELARARMGRVIDARKLPFPHAKKLIQLYEAVKKRCIDPNNKSWKYYGERGIKMCAEWLENRHAFYQWCTDNGYSPGLWIDRIDVNGNYEPSNCRFATVVEQMNNKRNSRLLEWNGLCMTLTQWEQKLGFPRNLLNGRITRGWDIERAMTEPVRARP